jgi:hypothetical protein
MGFGNQAAGSTDKYPFLSLAELYAVKNRRLLGTHCTGFGFHGKYKKSKPENS